MKNRYVAIFLLVVVSLVLIESGNSATVPTGTISGTVRVTDTIVTKPEIGVYNQLNVSGVDNPKLTWHFFAGSANLRNYSNPDKSKVVYAIYTDWTPTNPKWTDYVFMSNMFNKSKVNINYYNYGVFLLREEMYGPTALGTWAEPYSNLNTVGYIKFNCGASSTTTDLNWDGSHCIVAKFRDTWKAENPGKTNYDWEVNYTTQIYTAWNEYMHYLGKKSAVIGILSLDNTAYNTDLDYQMPAHDYVLKNYDLIVDYTYPRNSSEVLTYSLGKAVYLNPIYTKTNGIFVWILTADFQNRQWTWSESVAQNEFNTVAPYVDVIAVYPHTKMRTSGNSNPSGTTYPKILVNFWDAYNP